jgi:S1-C subfamily serine protease
VFGVRRLILAFCLVLSACGGAEPEPRVVPAARVAPAEPARPPGTIWRDAGDVVTRVNGMPIERETEAYDAFQALRTAGEVRVSLLRGGVPRVLSYRIAERPRSGKSALEPVTPAKTPPPRP